MAREVYVNLGGEERRVMFDAARAAILIEQRLKQPPLYFVDHELWPNQQNPLFSTTTLCYVLWIGLKHADPKLTENTVIDWVSEAYMKSKGMLLCQQVRDAMLLSGVCGFFLDQQAEPEEETAAAQEGDGDAGKDAVKPSDAP